MKYNISFKIFLSTLLIYFLIENSIGQNGCMSKEQCDKCIQTKNCAWCTKENFQNQPRCFKVSSQFYNSCTEKFIVNPKTVVEIKKSEQLTRTKLKNKEIKNDENPKIVQLKPQHVSLKLRPHEVYKLHFEYSLAEDAPMDLYYLMDLSTSMLKHKNTLSLLGEKLAETMKTITKNFRLGFGSFVDKVLMPFTSVSPDKLKNPCSKENPCAPPYSYQHHMTLSTDASKFKHEVEAAKVSANIDSPEGGFDAIMQAIVCWEQIGWRESARHILVYSSDAAFHYAGDGKLAGIIQPNDGECHMEGNRYTHAEILDYPSVSQINYTVKANAVNLIFAVTKNVGDIYKELSEAIEGASYGILDQDSSNVVELIKNEYNKITSSVEITDTAEAPVSIKYFTPCVDPNGKLKEQNKCSGTKHESIINFEAEIKVSECPDDKKDWKQQIKIYPIGVDESIIIDLEILCDCDCEKSGHPSYETNSEKCNKHGTYKCGLCHCNDKYFGGKCECSSDSDSGGTSSTSCRPNNTIDVDCSGFGICRCGVCECNKRGNPEEIISGRFCECDNFQCPRSQNKQLCSGEDHGTCECGECKCKSEWSGRDCNCKASNDTCFESLDFEICSGHGECNCGECVCDERYSGQFCKNCPTCKTRCDEFKYCVECQAYNSGPLAGDECSKNCTLFNTTIVDKIESIKNDTENDRWHVCTSIVDNNCKFIFEYREFLDDKSKVEVKAEKEKECQTPISTAATASSIVLPLLSLGLLGLFSWKVVTTVHDRREYTKFEKEKLMAKWNTDDNPLFKEASTLYRNPGFEH